MIKKCAVIGSVAGVTLLLAGCMERAPRVAEVPPVMLQAQDAKVDGALRIQTRAGAATIHYWNNLRDTISWQRPAVQPGNYRVVLNYALDKSMAGGRIALRVNDQEIVAPAAPTSSWTEFRDFDLGVVRIHQAAGLAVALKAEQLPAVARPALPDVAWLSLTWTEAAATSTGVAP